MTTTNADVMPSDPMAVLRDSIRRTVSAQLADDADDDGPICGWPDPCDCGCHEEPF